MKIASQHAEAVSQCSRVCVEERFLFNGIALDAADVTPGNEQSAAAIEPDLADADRAIGERTAVPARVALKPAVWKMSNEIAFTRLPADHLSKSRHSFFNCTPAVADRLPDGTEYTERSAGTLGTSGSVNPRADDSFAGPDRERPHRTTILTGVPHAGDTNGVWLDYNGVRWFSSGPATVFSPERFEPIGEYHGFLVYRAKYGDSDELWVASVKDGPLAPYRRR
jgi:hypothetical protein